MQSKVIGYVFLCDLIIITYVDGCVAVQLRKYHKVGHRLHYSLHLNNIIFLISGKLVFFSVFSNLSLPTVADQPFNSLNHFHRWKRMMKMSQLGFQTTAPISIRLPPPDCSASLQESLVSFYNRFMSFYLIYMVLHFEQRKRGLSPP